MNVFHGFMDALPAGAICESCGERPATEKWAGTQDFMALNHGGSVEYWCELCTVREQLKYAEEELADLMIRLPDLRSKLTELQGPS